MVVGRFSRLGPIDIAAHFVRVRVFRRQQRGELASDSEGESLYGARCAIGCMAREAVVS